MSVRFLIVIVVIALGGCASSPADQPLFESLGGKTGIERISGRFIAAIAERPEIRPYFLHTDLERFHRQFISHLCDIAGGPCEYEGDTMAQTHLGMDITEGHFNQVVDMLVDAMEAEGIPYPVQNRLLARLAPMRKNIIYY